jgi:ACS family glucarate transporter-like MFS transporter
MGYLITLTQGYDSTFIFLTLVMWVSGLLMLPLLSKSRFAARDAA